MTEVCVIGCGHMGAALLEGLSKTEEYTLIACDIDPDARERVSPYCSTTTSDLSVASDVEIVIVAVKPSVVRAVLDELDLSPDQTLVSIAAGVSTDIVEEQTEATVVRVMPNLAAKTQNMAAAVTSESVTDDVRTLLGHLGEFVEIEEAQMDIATAVNGSGPAFVFYLVKAMQAAGVEAGLDDDDARTLAAQTFKGAAETVLRSEEPISDLIDAVCSPNGTTIEGMNVLWDSDVADTIAEAVLAAEQRSKELADERDDE